MLEQIFTWICLYINNYKIIKNYLNKQFKISKQIWAKMSLWAKVTLCFFDTNPPTVYHRNLQTKTLRPTCKLYVVNNPYRTLNM